MHNEGTGTGKNGKRGTVLKEASREVSEQTLGSSVEGPGDAARGLGYRSRQFRPLKVEGRATRGLESRMGRRGRHEGNADLLSGVGVVNRGGRGASGSRHRGSEVETLFKRCTRMRQGQLRTSRYASKLTIRPRTGRRTLYVPTLEPLAPLKARMGGPPHPQCGTGLYVHAFSI